MTYDLWLYNPVIPRLRRLHIGRRDRPATGIRGHGLSLSDDRPVLDRGDLAAAEAAVLGLRIAERHEARPREAALLDRAHEVLAVRVLARVLQRLRERVRARHAV